MSFKVQFFKAIPFFFLLFRDRLTADACLKHSWIKSIPAAKNLKKNKKNLKNVSKNNNYYLFDASNKTMSVASTQDVINPGDEDEWEWEDEALVSLI